MMMMMVVVPLEEPSPKKYPESEAPPAAYIASTKTWIGTHKLSMCHRTAAAVAGSQQQQQRHWIQFTGVIKQNSKGGQDEVS